MSIAHNTYLIERLMPAGEIHLLGGPTGAGKTRWGFQTILQWQAGLPILGYRSNPVPWVYVAADRSAQAAKRTLDDMQIDSSKIPFIAAWDRHLTLNGIFDAVRESGAKLVFFEAFGSFVDGNNKTAVKSYLASVHSIARSQDLTILGVMESPKMKPKDSYDNPRQRISGVATWGHFCETIFLLEPANAKDPSDPARMFYACPRNGQGIKAKCEIRPPLGTFHFLP